MHALKSPWEKAPDINGYILNFDNDKSMQEISYELGEDQNNVIRNIETAHLSSTKTIGNFLFDDIAIPENANYGAIAEKINEKSSEWDNILKYQVVGGISNPVDQTQNCFYQEGLSIGNFQHNFFISRGSPINQYLWKEKIQ